jgi:hypothetical protein
MSIQKNGGIWFARCGVLRFSFCVSRKRLPHIRNRQARAVLGV